MSRKLRITTGADRYDRKIKQHEVTWSALVKKLTTFKKTDETYLDYVNAGNEKLAMKDVGWFVGGYFDPNVRRRDNLRARSLLTLDADHLAPGDDVLSPYEGLEMVWHTSHSHSSKTPRLRLVFPLSRDVRPEEYEPLARAVASMAGMDLFDDTGYQVSRIMFWPSHSSDGEHESGHQEGEWIDPDFVLGLHYSDPSDFGEWPQSSREKEVGGARGTLRKAEPPWEKAGVIGAFCRTFDIPEVIERFELPYLASGMGEGRYSYAEGSSVDGAIYYPDTGHLYSWHESDPARGNNNAWDLVRIHEFGDLDKDAPKDASISELPSQKAMVRFAHTLKPVIAELAAKEFDFEAEDVQTEIEEKLERARKTRRQSYEELLNRVLSDCPADGIETNEFLKEIAAANLPADLEGKLMRELKSSNGSTMGDLRAGLKDAKRGLVDIESRDPQIALIDHVLREHYDDGDHLRRINGIYWMFDHGVWRPEGDERVNGKLQMSIVRLREDRPEDYRELVIAVGEKETSALVSSLCNTMARHLAAKEAGSDPLQLRRHPPAVMNCRNGEIWFNEDGTHEFRKHDPYNFFTTQLDVDYDPKATCPEWDRLCGFAFADSLFPDEMQRHLEELGGYLLQMSRPMKTIVFMHGRSNAGKSTVGSVITNMLGESALTAPLDCFEGDSHATAALQGKLLVMDDDMTRTAVLDDGFLKRISEAKLITVNPKNKDKYTILSLAVPMVISNGLPRIKSQDEAIANRLLVFSFDRAIPKGEQDPRRAVALLEERSGILNRFIAGFARLHSRGHWEEPIDCVEARAVWRRESNPVARWIDECLDRTGDSKDVLRQADLYPLYRNWMEHEGMGRYVKGRNHFLEDVRDTVGASISLLDGYLVLRGYRLHQDPFGEDEEG